MTTTRDELERMAEGVCGDPICRECGYDEMCVECSIVNDPEVFLVALQAAYDLGRDGEQGAESACPEHTWTQIAGGAMRCTTCGELLEAQPTTTPSSCPECDGTGYKWIVWGVAGGKEKRVACEACTPPDTQAPTTTDTGTLARRMRCSELWGEMCVIGPKNLCVRCGWNPVDREFHPDAPRPIFLLAHKDNPGEVTDE